MYETASDLIIITDFRLPFAQYAPGEIKKFNISRIISLQRQRV